MPEAIFATREPMMETIFDYVGFEDGVNKHPPEYQRWFNIIRPFVEDRNNNLSRHRFICGFSIIDRYNINQTGIRTSNPNASNAYAIDHLIEIRDGDEVVIVDFFVKERYELDEIIGLSVRTSSKEFAERVLTLLTLAT